MASTIGQSLLGDISVFDGVGSPTTGDVPVYAADGTLPQTSPSRATAGIGGTTIRMPLILGRSDTGLTMDATGAAGLFHIVNTTGTSLVLLSEAANNGTKTDYVLWETQVPEFYKAASNLTVTVNAFHTLNGGTATVKTILADVYLLATAGTSGATLVATSAATLTTSAADYAFVVTGTTLTPNARIILRVKGVVTETASGGGVTITVNSVRIS